MWILQVSIEGFELRHMFDLLHTHTEQAVAHTPLHTHAYVECSLVGRPVSDGVREAALTESVVIFQQLGGNASAKPHVGGKSVLSVYRL
jgi:hypothetical protein